MIGIRNALPEDVPSLVSLIDQLGYPMDPSILIENVNVYLRDPDRSLFVAEIEGKVVGCIASDMAQTFHREGKHMRVVSLVVDRALRRKGIGKALLEEAEGWARQQGCWVIEVTSSFRRKKEGTHDFYTKQGYLKNSSQYFCKLLTPSSEL